MRSWQKKAIPELVALVEQGLVKVRLAARMADESAEMQDAFVYLVWRGGMKPTKAEHLIYETIDYIMGEAEMEPSEAANYVKFNVEHGGYDESYWR